MDFALADLFECVADHVEGRVAIVCGHQRLTYGELDRLANQVAHGLTAAGVTPGDHVGLHLYDSVEHVAAMLGCYKARAVPVNVNWRYRGDELTQLFNDAELVGLVHHSAFADRVAEVAPRVATLFAVIEVGPHGFGPPIADAPDHRDFAARSGDDHTILYTGGTTGLPKGVVWRQEDIFFAVLGGGNPGGAPIQRPEEIGPAVVRNTALRLGPYLPAGDPGPEQFVQIALGPMMHASGLWSALGTLLGGGRIVIDPDPHFDPVRVLELVAQEGIVSVNLTGDSTALPLLTTLETDPDRWDTSSVRIMGSGGAMLSADSKQRLLDAIPSLLVITEAIGSSETPVQGISVVTRESGVGESLHFLPREETRVLDDEGHAVAAGSGIVGRLATRGRLPLGYHRDGEKTARTFVDIDGERWSLPGDMATLEPDGRVRVLGRGSLCINTGGEKVYPEEVEAVLVAHPAVADALVVGRPDARWGEQVVAVVAPTDPDQPPDLPALEAHCRPNLAGYKIPRALHLVDAVRRSPAGKGDYAWATRLVSAAGDDRAPG